MILRKSLARFAVALACFITSTRVCIFPVTLNVAVQALLFSRVHAVGLDYDAGLMNHYQLRMQESTDAQEEVLLDPNVCILQLYSCL
jgi:hypothetical protein